MTMATTWTKVAVCNPLHFRNTVGGELADMCEDRGVPDYEQQLGVRHLRQKERLSQTVLAKAAKLLDNEQVPDLLSRFQAQYLAEKPACQRAYREAKAAFARLKRVIPLMRGEFTDGYDLLDDILDFFGVSSEREIEEQSLHTAALFRGQHHVGVDGINLLAWLRRGELDFQAMKLPEYDESGLLSWVRSGVWESHLEDVPYFKSLPDQLAAYGVGLVYVPFLPKTVYGAIRWMDNRPLIQLSDRNRDIVSCWFTLFHEIGHAVLHKHEEIYEADINDVAAVQNQREREANKFANKYLFHGDQLRKAVFERKRKGQYMTANSLAAEFQVQPILASYWLLKAQYEPAFQRRVQIDFVAAYQ